MNKSPFTSLTCLCTVIIICCFASAAAAEIGQLHICGPSAEKHSPSLVYVSTLDGRVHALDAASQGKKQWTLNFNDEPLLSSNIHRKELNNNGQWVRLIPSLNGGLYKFDGENLEAVPISADQLLRSSFRYSDDLVFSGGKETRSYGVSSLTGEILYECSIHGCNNKTGSDRYVEQDVLIVQRFQQTVRAIEPRTGAERWNFSVAQHELVLIPQSNPDCQGNLNSALGEIDLRAVVPEGILYAVNKKDPSAKLWQYKFDSPIVSVWREDLIQTADSVKSLKEVDMFDGNHWSWGSDFVDSPGIYVGMHERQLYIQESKKTNEIVDSSPEQTKKFPWQPYPAAVTAIATVDNDNKQDLSEVYDVQSITALSVLYNSEYINGNGYYLYSKEQLRLDSGQQCNTTNHPLLTANGSDNLSISDFANEVDQTPVQVIIISLWYWWKEVLLISITTAILLNFVLTQKLINANTRAQEAVLPPLIVERHVVSKTEDRKKSVNDDEENFKSRYLTDFEPVDCLGKGGYGIVFEAKNKIDDCNYAIKRIGLPNSQDSRERVMREVKALAKLDHHNIVRYFNAWLECPPPGWQEIQDSLWRTSQKFPSSEFPTQSYTKSVGNSIHIDVPQSEPSSIDSAIEACELDNNCNDDSYIVFERDDNDEIVESTTPTTELEDYEDDYEESSNANSQEYRKRSTINIQEDDEGESIVFQVEGDDDSKESLSRKNSRDRKISLSQKLDKSVDKRYPKMFLYIQMQLCQRLSLREWLKQQVATREKSKIINIFQQIVSAVEYVHLQGLIHRDLKPSNIFFAYDDKIKIGDFGLVTAMTEGCDRDCVTVAENSDNRRKKLGHHTARVGTHLYMSPEQMNGQMYNYKVDIYSLGIIFFELLTPFQTEMERVISLSDLRKSVFPNNFEANYPDECNLLKMMLDEVPEKRPTTVGVKARPPLSNCSTPDDNEIHKTTDWHFKLPQLSKHSSITSSSSSGDSWENFS